MRMNCKIATKILYYRGIYDKECVLSFYNELKDCSGTVLGSAHGSLLFDMFMNT